LFKIRRIALVGAGTIGRQWASFYASRGFQVSIYDVKPNAVKVALSEVRRIVPFLARKKFVSSSMAKKGLSAFRACKTIEETLDSADLIQESVFEDGSLKRSVISEVEKHVHSEAIIASSTGGGVLPSQIQRAMQHPDRFLVIHPTAQPVYIDPVTELVPGPKTRPEVLWTVKDFLEKHGKIAIVLNKEVEGYVANRLYFLVWREALDIVSRGIISPDDLDRLYCNWNLKWLAGVGPFLETHLHGGSGGKGGFPAALEHYSRQLPYLWKTTATWEEIPAHVRRNALSAAKKMRAARGKSIESLKRQRDLKRLEISRLVSPKLTERTRW